MPEQLLPRSETSIEVTADGILLRGAGSALTLIGMQSKVDFLKSMPAERLVGAREPPPVNGDPVGSPGECSDCHSQLDRVVRRMNKVLLRPQVTLRRLHRRVTQKQLDLFKLAASGAA